MTTPALTSPGSLGSLSYGANGTVELTDYVAVGEIVAILLSTPQAGTVNIYRVVAGVETLRYVVTLAASVEEHEIRLRCYGFQTRIRFTNTDNTAGTIAGYGI